MASLRLSSAMCHLSRRGIVPSIANSKPSCTAYGNFWALLPETAARSSREFPLRAAEQRAHGADYPASKQHDDNYQSRRQTAGDIRMPGCQPCEADGDSILAQAESDVRERLG